MKKDYMSTVYAMIHDIDRMNALVDEQKKAQQEVDALEDQIMKINHSLGKEPPARNV